MKPALPYTYQMWYKMNKSLLERVFNLVHVFLHEFEEQVRDLL